MEDWKLFKNVVNVGKVFFLIILSMFVTSCFVLNGLIYHGYDKNLNMQVAHFNVYDNKDYLINTSIYKNNVVVLTFLRFAIFKNEQFIEFDKYYNKIINHFSKFPDIKFVNIAVGIDQEQWLKILSSYSIKGDNYLCKDDQYKIYNFSSDKAFNLSLIYSKDEKILGYDLLQDGLMVGPFYALKNIPVSTGSKIIFNHNRKKWDPYAKYIANELEKTVNDSTYVFNPYY